MGQKGNKGIQKPIRFPQWMALAIQKIADEEGMTFTDIVLDLIRQELKEMGITLGIGRESNEFDPEATHEIIRDRSKDESKKRG
jgi:hypothetical protein